MASGFNGSVMAKSWKIIFGLVVVIFTIISLGLSCDAFNYLNRGV